MGQHGFVLKFQKKVPAQRLIWLVEFHQELNQCNEQAFSFLLPPISKWNFSKDGEEHKITVAKKKKKAALVKLLRANPCLQLPAVTQTVTSV